MNLVLLRVGSWLVQIEIGSGGWIYVSDGAMLSKPYPLAPYLSLLSLSPSRIFPSLLPCYLEGQVLFSLLYTYHARPQAFFAYFHLFSDFDSATVVLYLPILCAMWSIDILAPPEVDGDL